MFFFGVLQCLVLGLVLADQNPVVYDKTETREKIAIIGAGAGGSSAAYYLQKFSGKAFDITIFEKSDSIGGRTQTVDVYGNSSLRVEVGASIYVSANKILAKAVKDFNLTTFEPGPRNTKEKELKKFGLYDGTKIFFTFDLSWISLIRLLWRYGRSLITTERIAHRFVSTFLKFYYKSEFPFPSLDVISHVSGLLSPVSITGEEVLVDAGVDETCYKELVQSLTRANYAQNIDQIHGLGAMVSLLTDGAVLVEGGAWQIFSKFVEASGAAVKFNEPVSALKKLKNGKWKVTSGNSTEKFDQVIIASPWGQTNISGLGHITVPKVDYVDLHVTIFTSTQKLSPLYFGEDEFYKVPGSILTTVYLSKTPPLKYFAISVVDYVEETEEYVFKIFSPEKVSDADIKHLFLPLVQINWVHRKEWKSYPYLVPTSEFADFDQDEGLWYLNGMESFISTMETSALAGANVAALMCKGRNTTDLVIP